MAVVALAAAAGLAASELGASLTVVALAQAVGSFVGSLIDAAIFAPPAQNQQGPKLDSLKATQADYGAALPNTYGIVNHAGTLIWQDDIEEVATTTTKHSGGMLGIGGQTTHTTLYTYFCSFAIAICDNPIGQLNKIFADGKLIWQAGMPLGINVDSLKNQQRDTDFLQGVLAGQGGPAALSVFGPDGAIREGAGDLAAALRLYNGTQTYQDPLMVAKLGPDVVPAYKGLSYIVFERMALKNYGNRIPNLKFEYTTNTELFDLQAMPGNVHGMTAGSIFSGVPWPVAENLWCCVGQKDGKFHATTHRINAARTASELVDDVAGPDLLDGTEGFETSVSPDASCVAAYAVAGGTVRVGFYYPTSKSWKFATQSGLLIDDILGRDLIWLGGNGVAVMSLDAPSGNRLYHVFTKDGFSTTAYSSAFAEGHPVVEGRALADCVGVPFDDKTTICLHSVFHEGKQELWAKQVRMLSPIDIRFGNPFKVGQVPDSWHGETRRGFVQKIGNEWLLSSCSYVQQGNAWIATGGGNDRGEFRFSRQPLVPPNPGTGNEVVTTIGTHGIGVFAFGDGRSLYAEMVLTATGFAISRSTMEIPGEVIGTSLLSGRSYWATCARDGFVGMWPDPSDFQKFVPIKIYDGNDTVDVAHIVADRLKRSGYQPQDYDVSAINDAVVGYVVDKPMAGRSSIDPLQYYSLFDLIDSDGIIKARVRDTTVVAEIPDELVGAVEDGADGSDARTTFTRGAEADLPYQLVLGYLDPARDYQINAVLASRFGGYATQKSQLNIAICCDANRAKGMAIQNLMTTWGQRTSITGSVPLDYAWLDVGDCIKYRGMTIRLMKTTIGAGTIDFEGNQVVPVQQKYSLSAFGGTYVKQVYEHLPDSFLQVLDIPSYRDGFGDDPALTMAVTLNGSPKAWRGCSIARTSNNGGSWDLIGDVGTVATVGTLSAPLGTASPALFDSVNALTITLPVGSNLGSVPLLEAHSGNNAVLVGSEIIYYATATQVDATTWTLTDLLRGRRGTEQYIDGHGYAERVVVLGGCAAIGIGFSDIGRPELFTAISAGLQIADAELASQPCTPIPACARPYSPIHVQGTRDGAGNLTLTWDRRTRSGGDWIDFQDAPLFENAEAYEIDYLDGSGTILRTVRVGSPTASYSVADQAHDLGAASPTVSVAVYQCGAIGRGFPAYAVV